MTSSHPCPIKGLTHSVTSVIGNLGKGSFDFNNYDFIKHSINNTQILYADTDDISKKLHYCIISSFKKVRASDYTKNLDVL